MHVSERLSPHLTSGVRYAVGAAILFGASVPFSKRLLETIPPTTLAGILYLGSGAGLAGWRLFRRFGPAAPDRRRQETSLSAKDLPWLGLAILFGGVISPVLLLVGLRSTPAATGSLLLNLEGVLTAGLAWFVFREHFDRRIAIGMAAIIAGGVLLSWQSGAGSGRFSLGMLAIVGACLGWAADNNFTRKVSAADPMEIAMWKGLVAGTVNFSLGWITEPQTISLSWAWAGIVGFLSYGLSLAAFVLALRHLGSARTGAYFSMAPFVGVVLSLIVLREVPSIMFWPAAILMAFGVWLHFTERHGHEHLHEALEHDHLHMHDEHHQHAHEPSDPPGEPHAHPHRHGRLLHSHPHTPDIHHQHRHD